MLCLGIETSCDETALALIENGKILNEVLASQATLHSVFGGVVPELASREHLRSIGALFDELMAISGKQPENISRIAVARGPGLLGSLLVGGSFAKALALTLAIPIIAVNHLHAHLLACGINNSLKFPALGLVASGGHTHIYRINSPSDMILLGRSLDDACGEAFDKIGNFLGFPYPAGKFIDECAQKGDPNSFSLPLPYLDNANLDFSFSGLKTAAVSTFTEKGIHSDHSHFETPEELNNFCASFNEVIAKVLEKKISRALESNNDVKSLWFAGGVAANTIIRKRLAHLAKNKGLSFLAPDFQHCTDNAAMIAYTGWLLASEDLATKLDFEIIPRGKRIPEDLVHIQ